MKSANGSKSPSLRPRGVTHHLQTAGILSSSFFLDDRVFVTGRRVHNWTAKLDLDEPLPRRHGKHVVAHCECYRIWRQHSSMHYEEVEEMIISWTLGYCGIIDRATPGVLDIKTGAAQAWHRVQTAAYAVLVSPSDYLHVPRHALYLHPDRPARLVPHTRAYDFVEWFDALRRSHEHANSQKEAFTTA